MLIITGNVKTKDGYKAVAELRIGDEVIDSIDRVRKISAIRKGIVDKTVSFRREGIIISADSILVTPFGEQVIDKSKRVTLITPAGRMIRDDAIVEKRQAEGYEISLEIGEGLVVGQYIVKG